MVKGQVPDYLSAIKSAKLNAKKLIVDAPALKRSHYDWTFQETDNQDLIRFRERFQLEKVIENASDEWHAIRLIRNWVYMQNSRGGGDGPNGVSQADTESLVLACNAGASFFCTYFARMMVAATLSLGFVSRLVSLGVDFDRWNKNRGHGVCEVWVNDFKKWVLIDAHFDKHFEIKGVPLNTYEIHRAAVEGREAEVDYSKGPDGQLIDPYENGRGWPDGGTQLDLYFWHNYHLKNTPFHVSGSWDFTKYILLEDDSHQGKTWNQGKNKKHIAYQHKFISETNIDEVYFDVNSVYLEPKIFVENENAPENVALGGTRGIVVFNVGTFTPNLSGLEIKLDGKHWQPQTVWTRVQWALHKGDNSFAVRTVNKFGRKGPITKLEAHGVEFMQPKKLAKSELENAKSV
jgi:hypothetical protein